MALLKRTLSGTLGKNLIDVEFSTGQVAGSDEHRLLMALRNSSLKDEEAVQALYQKVIGSLSIEGDYLILLTHDTYDVPYRSRDGQALEDASLETLMDGIMTKDLLPLVEPGFQARGVNSREFLDAIAERLTKKLA